jgi:superfamily I DNA/RNA helicase
MSQALSNVNQTIWSPLQEAIFAEVETGSGHLVIEACPGSGKTTTEVEALTRTDPSLSVLASAFGRETVASLKDRLPRDITVQTWNGYGMRAVMREFGRLDLKPYETHDRAGAIVGKGRINKNKRDFIVKLVEAAKSTLTESSHDALDELADQFDLETPKGCTPAERAKLVRAACQILDTDAEGPRGNVITYSDQCWLPYMLDLPCPEFDLVGVDETQDLNAAQLWLAQRAALNGRIIAVGDRRQSIFGFRGADRHAIPRMIETLQAKTLPLNVCYRCGANIVAEAARIWPEIIPHPDAPGGIVRDSDLIALKRQAQPGDFVVSRLNAPLISLCLGWLAAGVRAQILGKDIGAALINWIKAIGASNVDQILSALDAWEAKEIARLEAKDRPTEQVSEKAECIRALCEGLDTVDQVEARAETLFAAGPAASAITLASTHKAKGLEAHRVWLLRDTYCRVWKDGRRGLGGDGWQHRPTHDPANSSDEEKNLFYVGITRAKEELIYVKGM